MLLIAGLALPAAPALAEAPANDNFANAETIGSLPAAVPGTNVDATHETGEPAHHSWEDVLDAEHSVWYAWTPDASGAYDLNLCESDFDTLLAVYTGSSVDALTEVAANDDAISGDCGTLEDGTEQYRGSALSFDAVGGTTYHIAVDGYPDDFGLPATGTFTLRIEPPPPEGPAADDPGGVQLTPNTDTESASNELAGKFDGEPDHAGDPGGHSLWYYLEAPSDGQVTLDTCTSDVDTVLAVYTFVDTGLEEVASNDDGSPCGSGADELTFNATEGESYHVAVDGKSGATGTLVVNLTSDFTIPDPPDNDNFADAQVLNGSTITQGGTNTMATGEPGEPNHLDPVTTHTRKSVWYSWTPSETGWYAVDTCTGTSFDSVLAVYTGSQLDLLDRVAQDDDGCAPGSNLTFEATSGTTYLIAVDGYPFATENEFGDFTLRIQPTSPPPPEGDDPGYGLGNTGKGSLVDRTNEGATKYPGEADHGGNAGGHSVWYLWTAPKTGNATFDTCGSGIDTVIAAYSDVDMETGSETLIGQNDDTAGCGPNGHGSRISFSATAGAGYFIAVDGKDGTEGSFRINWVQAGGPANDHRSDAELLEGVSDSGFGNNSFASTEWNEPPHGPPFAGDMAFMTVWYRWTAPGDGPVTVDTCGSGFDTLLAAYEGDSTDHVSDDDDSCDTDETRSSMDFEADGGTTYYFAVDTKSGLSGAVVINLSFTGTVTNDPPSCSAVSTSTPRGTAKAIQLSCTDPEGGALTLEAASDPQHGTLTTVNQTTDRVTYVPDDGYTGADSFTYSANDGTNDSAAATVSIDVTAPGGGTPTGGGGGLTSTLSVAKTKLAKLLKQGLPVSFGCDAACSAKFALLMSAKDAKKLGIAAAKQVVIGKGSGKLTAAGKKKAMVRLAAKAKRRLKKVRSVKVTLRSTFTDAAGKRTVKTKRLTLKR